MRALRQEVVELHAAALGGRIFKTTGDGLLVEFPSAVQALRCAIAIQDSQCEHNGGRASEYDLELPEAERLHLRIGVHQGEVVPEGDDLLGDGVVVAARLEPLAEPGGICISGRVREDAAGKVTLDVDYLGVPALKNITQKVRVFRVLLSAEPKPALALPDMPSLAVSTAATNCAR